MHVSHALLHCVSGANQVTQPLCHLIAARDRLPDPRASLGWLWCVGLDNWIVAQRHLALLAACQLPSAPSHTQVASASWSCCCSAAVQRLRFDSAAPLWCAVWSCAPTCQRVSLQPVWHEWEG
jgi:hypothetical protein